MGRNDGFVDAVHVFHQVADLGSVFIGQAVARRVGNVDHRGPGLDHGFDHTGEVFVLGAAGIFGIELHVLHVALGIFDGPHGPLDDLLAVGVELVADVAVRGADAGVDALVLGVLQGLHRHVDVFLHGPGQAADGGPGHGLGDFHHGVEVTGARNGKSGLDDIDAQLFQRFGNLDFFNGVELAAGDLFPVAERRVEDVNSFHFIQFPIEIIKKPSRSGSGRFQFIINRSAKSFPAALNTNEEQQQGQGQGEIRLHA